MAFKETVIILALAGFCSAGSVKVNRITGGTPTTIDSYPSLVQVEFFILGVWSQSCAGTILTSRYVLSVAQCFDGPTYDPSSRRIRAGTTQRHVGGQVVGVEWARVHPSFHGYPTNDGDIVVVRTTAALVYTPLVQQGSIPFQGYQIPDNAPVVQAGWGALEDEGPPSETLRHTTIYTVNNELCTDIYINTWPSPSDVTTNMICAGRQGVGGAGACTGDAGGPLVYGNVVVGVISWGSKCGDPFFPSVSTAVSSYTNWILETAV